VNFEDSYNAQTLEPWFVPHLLVDPDGRWVRQMSTPGPQVIVGMRGCGKTMLLRALQFHARATKLDNESQANVLERLKSDRFIGLYASSTMLLDRIGEPAQAHADPHTRLYVTYALEGLRAIRHLKELDFKAIAPSYFRDIGAAISDYLSNAKHLRSLQSEDELERALLRLDVEVRRGNGGHKLLVHPATAFAHIAQAIRDASSTWKSSCVLFLLDDVSTRYLRKEQIEALISSLLFPSPICAFKLTSEAQTLAFVLSPGRIETARVGRDYEVFDLGTEVYGRISKQRGDSGIRFVENILFQRAAKYNHPSATPRKVLGDNTLREIAERIASRSPNVRRQVYFGLTALARVCVGDIGDIISLYALILKKWEGIRLLPVSPTVQSEAYQEFCARRLYDLSRRDNWLKDMALAFSQASHQLLVQSYRKEVLEPSARRRLRQYSSVYIEVRLSGEDEREGKIIQRIRDLVDSGVFVFTGASEIPRSKTQDGRLIQQFKLTFRKIYGLSSFIGLAESDRFELFGDDLEKWLLSPVAGREILLGHQGGQDVADDLDEAGGESVLDEAEEVRLVGQPLLPFPEEGARPIRDLKSRIREVMDERAPQIQQWPLEEFECGEIDVLVLGLGFEERTRASANRLLERCSPPRAVVVRLDHEGNARPIVEAVSARVSHVDTVTLQDVLLYGVALDGNVLVDVTGLPKSAIFSAVRAALKRNRRVWVCRTGAAVYYPSEREISRLITAEISKDHYQVLKQLRNVQTGEQGPYQLLKLLPSEADESRRHALCCSASAKTERLLSFLDERTYDRIEIATPNTRTNRSLLANIAAEVAARTYPGTVVTTIDVDDISTLVGYIVGRYQHWYVNGGLNFELALTGSKPEAVACAAVSAAFKISQCWYPRASKIDIHAYTSGVGRTTIVKISLPES
jgi:hypothetical protein